MQVFIEPTELEQRECAEMLRKWVVMMRERAAMTQEDFGNFVGVNKSAISMVETQVRIATAELIGKITFAFEVDALTSTEMAQSAAMGRIIVLPRTGDWWVFLLQPVAKGLSKNILRFAVRAFRGVCDEAREGMNGERGK